MFCELSTEILDNEIEIEIASCCEVEECVEVEIASPDVEVEIESQLNIGVPGQPGVPGIPGPPGPPGIAGPSGTFEIIPVTIIAVNVWQTIPLAVLTMVSDIEVFDQANNEKILIDIKLISNNIVQIRSKQIKTYNVHVEGY